MASRKQVAASRRNIRRARRAAKSKRTIAHLPKSVRSDLGRQAAKGRLRHGRAGRDLADRNREQIYEVAKQMGIPGRSKMGKWELIDALRGA